MVVWLFFVHLACLFTGPAPPDLPTCNSFPPTSTYDGTRLAVSSSQVPYALSMSPVDWHAIPCVPVYKRHTLSHLPYLPMFVCKRARYCPLPADPRALPVSLFFPFCLASFCYLYYFLQCAHVLTNVLRVLLQRKVFVPDRCALLKNQ